MLNWGYTITKDNQINMDTNNRSLYKAIVDVEPSFAACFSCGSCAATCSAGQFTNFSFRKLKTLLARGENDTLKTEIAKCMFCGKCMLVCPRGVNTRNALLAMHRFVS